MRCCSNEKTFERFLTFPSTATSSSKVTQVLDDCTLLVNNSRCQSCGQAAVKKGENKRLPALFTNINKYTEYVPFSADSLNIVGEKASCTVPEVVDNFAVERQLFVFFWDSSRRWIVINRHGNMRLRVTRWSAHYEAAQTLKYGENDVLGTTKYIFEDSEGNPKTNEMQNVNSKN